MQWAHAFNQKSPDWRLKKKSSFSHPRKHLAPSLPSPHKALPAAMVGLATFMIVSKDDIPQYECDFSGGGGGVGTRNGGSSGAKKDDAAHLHQFVMHASLDFVDARVWETTNMHLRLVDKFNDLSVYAFVTAGGTRFLLLHDQRIEESNIGVFFHDVHELWLRVSMNPFHTKRTPILDKTFDLRVRECAKSHFP
jgi:hypothetical protein